MSEAEAGAAEPAASSLLDAMTSTAGYAVRTFGTAAGLRGLAVETAWCTAHAASYPLGFWREHIRPAARPYRTDALSPEERGDLTADLDAPTGTPILLVHGFLDNRSVFAPLRRALHKRGFGVTHAVNHSLFTGDVRAAARDLRRHVERLRERTGADRVHVIGHSLGGLIARYFVQRLGGDVTVDNLVTLGTPHGGSAAAYLLPTPVTRQVLPGSELLAELAEPAPRCRTRFLVAWSRMDQLIVPQTNGRLIHPDLDVRTLEVPDVGHLSLAIHPRVVSWVAGSLARRDDTATPLEPEDDIDPRHLRPVGS
ncbi:alpha/beta fold hydrolase [Pseudonocardia eucalypti]|uniref:Alpha/beta fold hydrolase n=1 Tax=Pseudonocardia eucalypti TaxID=648755 RepID=A0ABP9PUY5_9PSEU|nr:pimeloyl-ACP methyl ester carboxylesterase [Pseudonocardia eucalypti]